MANVLFFGRLRDICGPERVIALTPGIRTLADVKAALGAADEAIFAALHAPGVRAALNQAFADDSALIAGDCEIAFMSPLSGG
ncbi:MAG: MoaD/ThiS family protein [Hyphomonadaceae bacterium]